MQEAAAAGDDGLLSRLLAARSFSEEQLLPALHAAVFDALSFPALDLLAAAWEAHGGADGGRQQRGGWTHLQGPYGREKVSAFEAVILLDARGTKGARGPAASFEIARILERMAQAQPQLLTTPLGPRRELPSLEALARGASLPVLGALMPVHLPQTWRAPSGSPPTSVAKASGGSADWLS